MRISAYLRNSAATHEVALRTGANTQALAVAAKSAGGGSSVNGGEFLMLALATCYCNDLYREAAARGLAIDALEVEASAEFAAPGLAAADIRYRARIESPAPPEAIEALLRETDAVAEVHNTLRAGLAVRRQAWDSGANP